MKKKHSILFFLMFLSVNLFSQEFPQKKELNKINKEYLQVLELSKEQSKKFKEILFNYNDKLLLVVLINQNSKKEINKLIKLLDLEMYELLGVLNFEKYKKLKDILEPYKKYVL